MLAAELRLIPENTAGAAPERAAKVPTTGPRESLRSPREPTPRFRCTDSEHFTGGLGLGRRRYLSLLESAKTDGRKRFPEAGIL